MSDSTHNHRETNIAALSFWPQLGVLLGMTLFWWSITGIFIGFAAYSLIMNVYAQRYYAKVQGVVLESKVIEDSSGDGCPTYQPLIKYRYAVGDRTYFSDNYCYGMISTSGCSAHVAVYVHPPGTAVTVYYDPNHHEQAVLQTDVPHLIWFLILFLQPFILAGLLMIGLTFLMPWKHRQIKRFFTGEPALPLTIPNWGVAREVAEGIMIRKPRRLVASALGFFSIGYGLTCFAAIFVLAFGFGAFADASPTMIGRTFMVAASGGLLCAVTSLFRSQGTTVLIDRLNGRLSVSSSVKDETVSFHNIESWQLRFMRYRKGKEVNVQKFQDLRLEAVTSDGRNLPVHLFRAEQSVMEGDVRAIAKRTQQILASWTAGEVCCDIATDALPETTQGLGQAIRS